MKCPVCRDIDLAMTHREGIEIDYCPQCRGVWLDRGELDKILERSAPAVGGRGYAEEPRYRSDDDYRHKQHKPKNILKEIFDF